MHFWISKNHAEFWISIIRFKDILKSINGYPKISIIFGYPKIMKDIYNSFLDILK